MTTTQKDKPAPHVYGSADPDNRQPQPANGMRGEGAGTPLTPEDPNETDKAAADKDER
jgi:hypothetical protein